MVFVEHLTLFIFSILLKCYYFNFSSLLMAGVRNIITHVIVFLAIIIALALVVVVALVVVFVVGGVLIVGKLICDRILVSFGAF